MATLGLFLAPQGVWDAALGAVIKDAKEQLRAQPDGLTYGLLRYLNPDVEIGGAEPSAPALARCLPSGNRFTQ